MNTTRIAVMAALLSSTFALPALAQLQPVGSIEIGGRDDMRGPPGMGRDRDMRGPGSMMGPNRDRDDRNVKMFELGGPVESLRLRAERSDVRCRSVDATFANGQRRNVFSGQIRENQTVNVDMPGRERNIRRLDFNCEAERGRGASIRILADVGRFRGDWQRSPNWQREWSKIFNWGSQSMNDWQMVGSTRFDGRRDQETTFTGRRGIQSDAIALKPLETDARCQRVTARFENGRQQNLDVNRGDVLRKGQFYKLDLPGDVRNVRNIAMTCGAVNGPFVTVQVFTSH